MPSRHRPSGRGTGAIRRRLMQRDPFDRSAKVLQGAATMKSIPLGITTIVLGIVAYLMLGAALAGAG
jgi:hypothetical protein